jgi:N-carbamoyl-L-amino-acid hydrolase
LILGFDFMIINEKRFVSNFENLAQIGKTLDGGVHRPTFSVAHQEARVWFKNVCIQSGLEFRIDNAGNHIARLNCGLPNAPTLLLGSHLDSVPNGGKFDGALGLIAALEVLLSFKDAAIPLSVHVEAIDFTDEEGTLIGLLGSSAMGGALKAEDLLNPRGGRDNLVNGFHNSGLNPEKILNAKRNQTSFIGYLELHIEQGPILQNNHADIGIVSSIVGICSYHINFIGRADHAGTTSMDSRYDAAQGASAFTLESRKLVLQSYPYCVVNIGQMEFTPGAFNIIPELVVVSLEFRAPEEKILKHLEVALLELALECGAKYNLGVEISSLGEHSPAIMSSDFQNAFEIASKALDLKTLRLASGAGHDAQAISKICPAGMIFVPSINGSSHSSKEYTKMSDCINGANVLLHTLHILLGRNGS